MLSHFLTHAHAQSSLGIGTNEATLPSTGLFAGWMNWINVQQQEFYRSLTGALKAMREDGSKLWLLVGLSFAYGIFHAAGPGHGKAVISSYMLANEVALRRGIMLSFVSAFLQAFTAIVVMTLVFLVLRGTVDLDDRRDLVPRSGELCADHRLRRLAAVEEGRPAPGRPVRPATGAQPVGGACACHSPWPCASRMRHAHAHAHAMRTHAHDACARIDRTTMRMIMRTRITIMHHGHGASRHADGEVCETCGHSHAPDPALLSGDRFDWRTAWSAVAAVGIRPCSGALIVLTFAFLNGLWAGGILSVLAMAVGTAITVSVLATLAVTAKNWAVAFAGDGRIGNRIHATIEIGGAALCWSSACCCCRRA